MNVRRKLERNLLLYKIFSFNKGLIFSLPIFALYFRETGLTYLHILLVFTAQSIAQFVTEIPSGICADYFGRKKVMFVYSCARVTMFIFFFFGDGVMMFMLGGLMMGIALACESGTNSAFLFDTLKGLKREAEYKKIEGNAYFYTLLAMGIGGFCGGFLGEISLNLPFLVTLVILLPLPVLCLFFTEPKQYKIVGDLKYLSHLKSAISVSMKNSRVKYLIIFWSIIMVGFNCTFPLLQPYMSQAQIPIQYFGLIYLIWLIVAAMSSKFAHAINERIGITNSLFIMPLFLSIPLILMGVYSTKLLCVSVILMEFVYGFIKPVLIDEINQMVESHQRATILSLKGFVQNIFYIAISPIIGYFADILSIQAVYLIEGLIILPLGLFLIMKIKNHDKKLYGPNIEVEALETQ